MSANSERFAPGRRVVIWGATGSGKTTLARELGRSLDLHVVDLDAIRHADGWDSTPFDEFRVRLTEELEMHAAGWVVSGSYSAISDVYLSRADTLIWLHLPWRVSFWRLLKRTVARARDGLELYPGSPARESWRLSFASRRSILLWSITNHRRGVRRARARIAELRATVRVHEMRTATDVCALVESLTIASTRA